MRARLALLLAAALALGAALDVAPAARASTAGPSDDPVLTALDAELARTLSGYASTPDPPYYVAYRVTEVERTRLEARYGALVVNDDDHSRYLDVDARVGSYELDSTHPIRERYSFGSFFNQRGSQAIPVDAEARALQTLVWEATGRRVQEAREDILRVRANRQVKVEETDPSPDFSREAPSVALLPRATVTIDRARWEGVLRALSARLDADPRIGSSEAGLSATTTTTWLVTSEGTRLRQTRPWLRIALEAASTASDGMALHLYRWKDVRDPASLPPLATLERWADELVADLLALREAPVGEPYTGPVLLRGAAAGVWVHEVLGHRAEGHRQKDEDEGQTFRDKVGEALLPAAIDVFDDPTVAIYAGEDLNGHYAFDEEGQPGRRAVLVDDGVFRGFLMSRSPIRGFEHSNGHGRANSSARPVARMANTILETSRPVPGAELRRMLVDEARKQGRDYGLLVEDLSGGFTMTGRVEPNTFNIRAETVWRVFVDGRPDQLVRGLDLVGTPLVALSRVVAAGDDPGVFNGWCGAESGSVPNSAVSPSLLLSQLEVQRKEKGQDRPPLLPKPEVGP